MFFDDWEALKRMLIVGTLAYVGLVIILRISGKRTLTKLNAFDLVITVALGSTLSAALINRSISLSEVLLAFSLLIVLQLAITWMSVRFRTVERCVKSEPTLLLHRGRCLGDAMEDQRVTRSELMAAIRSSGVAHCNVAAVVMETDGSLSVVEQASESDGALADVAFWPKRE
ncbi:conserved hypothetical protein [Rhodopseudomonas palustris TIE-1]|uniref:DUF421 domain-containing protein n=1 Tax=Rhodopseudomonas palustris TaxID=1076 RepID=UPI000164B483|nr:YetF domain-containing protein [Rhodopseudomonas palustris]ACF02319.1 conserved hypothetical protein [Rhodopseudomonas palustris TIE-1]